MADPTQSVQEEINTAADRPTSQPKDEKSDLTPSPLRVHSAPETASSPNTSSNVQSGAELVDALIKQTQPQGSLSTDKSSTPSFSSRPETPKGKKFSPMMLVGLVVLLITLPVLAFVLSGRDIVTLLPSRAGGNEGQPCSPGGAVECQSDGLKHWCDPGTLRWSGGGDSCSNPGVSCNISGYHCSGGTCYAENALKNDGTCGDVESTLSNCPNSCQTAPPPPSCGGCEGGTVPNDPNRRWGCNSAAGGWGYCVCDHWEYRPDASCPAGGVRAPTATPASGGGFGYGTGQTDAQCRAIGQIYCGACIMACRPATKTCNAWIDTPRAQGGCLEPGSSCGGNGLIPAAGQTCCTGFTQCTNQRCAASCTAECLNEGSVAQPGPNGNCCAGRLVCSGICRLAVNGACPAGTSPGSVPTFTPTPGTTITAGCTTPFSPWGTCHNRVNGDPNGAVTACNGATVTLGACQQGTNKWHCGLKQWLPDAPSIACTGAGACPWPLSAGKCCPTGKDACTPGVSPRYVCIDDPYISECVSWRSEFNS